MNHDSEERDESIFHEALEREPGSEREEFLTEACVGDSALRAAVERLLVAHEKAGSVFDVPAVTENDESDLEATTVDLDMAGHSGIPQPGLRIRYFGDYELLEEIARGGMGVVYRARQTNLKRTVALKMILAGRFAGEEDVQRFYTEAEAAARLDHPGIVPIYEIGEWEGQHYFSMSFVEGESLGERLRSGACSPREAAQMLKSIVEAVAYAHGEGVIHRDLKPANILLDKDDVPRITDFGLARKMDEESALTMSGQILGTPSFMPPEQAAGKHKEVGETADVYSLGAILYTLLTGGPPFRAANVMDTLKQVAEQEPVPPRQLDPGIPRDLEIVCLKCLQKEPRKRYATATALGDDMSRFLQGKPVHARPVRRAERAWRWCRRNPVVASLGAAAVLLGMAVVVASLIGYHSTTQALQRVEQTMSQADVDMGGKLLESGDTEEAIAHLARSLRIRPDNRSASYLLMWALSEHDYALPIAHFKHESRKTESFSYEVEIGFSPDESSLLIANDQTGVRHWNATEGSPLSPAFPNSRGNTRFAFSPDGQTLATGSEELLEYGPESQPSRLVEEGVMRLWSTASGTPLPGPSAKLENIEDIVFSSDGSVVAWISHSDGVFLWDAKSHQPLDRPLFGPGYPISSSRQQLVFGAFGRSLQLLESPEHLAKHDLRTGKTSWRLRALAIPESMQSSRTKRAVFGPSARTALVTSKDHFALLDCSTGNPISGPFSLLGCRYLVLSPDGTRVAGDDPNNDVIVWDTYSGEIKDRLRHHGWVERMAFSPDGNLLATVSSLGQTGSVRLWDLEKRGEDSRPFHAPEQIEDIAWSSTGAYLAAATQMDAFVCDVRKGRVSTFGASSELIDPVYDDHRAMPLALSGDGTRLAVLFYRTLFVYDTRSGARTAGPITIENRDSIEHAAFDDSGKRLFFSTGLGAVYWCDSESGKILGELDHVPGLSAFVISGSGEYLCAASDHDDSSSIWRIPKHVGKKPSLVHRIKETVAGFGFSSDGSELACVTFGDRNRVLYFDVPSWRITKKVKVPNSVDEAVFSADNSRVAVRRGNMVQVLDGGTGTELTTPIKSLPGLNGRSFALSRDGAVLAVIRNPNTVLLRDVATDSALLSPLPHALGGVRLVTFLAGGTTLMTSGERSAWRWNLPPSIDRAPDWFIDLAEALVQTTDENGTLVPASFAGKWARAVQGARSLPEGDPLKSWVTWVLADRSQRASQPFSSQTVAEHLKSLIARNTKSSLVEALRFAPMEPRIMAKLSLRLASNPTATPSEVARAQWLAEEAMSRAPDDDVVRRTFRDWKLLYAADQTQVKLQQEELRIQGTWTVVSATKGNYSGP